MRDEEQIKLTAVNGSVVIIGTLKYEDKEIYILRDEYGTEGIYSTRSYNKEKI